MVNIGSKKTKAEQMAALNNGKGVQYLLDESYKILKNPLVVFDTDYKLIAYTDVFADDPFWIELITTGTFCDETQMFFMEESFTDDVANAKKLAVMKSDKLKYDRMLGHIFNANGIKVANVLMTECNETSKPDTVAAFEILADLLTEEIRNEEFYIAYGEAYQDAWINRLINYDIKKKGLYSPHLQILYDGFKAHLYLAVVDIANSGGQHNQQKYFVDLFRQKQKDFKYAIHDKYIVMIMSTDYKTFNIKRELNNFVEYLEQKNFFVGISNCFDNLFELRRYYNEAMESLHRGINANSGQRIFLYEDLLG